MQAFVAEGVGEAEVGDDVTDEAGLEDHPGRFDIATDDDVAPRPDQGFGQSGAEGGVIIND